VTREEYDDDRAEAYLDRLEAQREQEAYRARLQDEDR
jgi:hypothetical protein